MRLPTPPRATAAALLLPSFVSAAWDCEAKHGGLTFDFTSLAGKHELFRTENTPPHVGNTTWQINPCGPLPKPKDENNECSAGTYVCALRRLMKQDGKEELAVITIAGDFDGRKLNESIVLFNIPDKGKGVRITLHGGLKYLDHEQSAVIDFVCDKERTGLEGSKAVDEGGQSMVRRDVSKADDKNAPSLKYIDYITEDKRDPKRQTLYLEWRTRQACEEFVKEGDKNSSSHWGFFTWLVIILFLGMAAYLIFGSWFNYNRYGARGWDLLPHSDTIRDIPYLLQDFMRHVVGTLQGRSSRGGYSAV